MSNHGKPLPPDSKPTCEAWEGMAELLTKTTQERDAALCGCDSLSAERDQRAQEVEILKAQAERLNAQAVEREAIANAALADLNEQVNRLSQEAGEGNGEPIEWFSMAQHAEGDYRVLRLTTPGVPPRAIVGERSMDPVEAEIRFRTEVVDLFERIGSTTR